jgi:serine/threonine protein kinase
MRRGRGAKDDFFPGFTDVSEIGVGSLATVFRAREVGTNRPVALKLLNVRDASPAAIESFERESVALGAVSSHPNIVTLFRFFRVADGRPVLVLELCRGAISDRMRGGHGLPVPEVVAVGIKIAGALESAHRAEILHRDVKPQNILITDFGEPALADFGVAMLQSSTQTTAGLFDFTTLHAAPELLEGRETSAATDVYELASSLYQMIAGRSAFRAYDGESPASVILRILRDPVQPLVNAQVPTELSDLLVYAMSKDKDSRPPTAAEFAAELAAVESAEGWPRTQFLIREPSGAAVRLPILRRLPPPTPEPVPAPVISRPSPGGHRPLPGQYPIPPTVPDEPTPHRPRPSPSVPTWASRAPAPTAEPAVDPSGPGRHRRRRA